MKVFTTLVLLLIEGRCTYGQNETYAQMSLSMGPTTMRPTQSPSSSVPPTVSPLPTADPSTWPSGFPSLQPTVSFSPTISPEPSSTPSSMPSSMPSLNTTIIAKRYYEQTFQAAKELQPVELSIFERFMESYTDKLEYGETNHIVTNCKLDQPVFNDTTSILLISYSMTYTTRYMLFENLIDYPDQFYASLNMTVLTEELALRNFPPGLVALELVMLDENEIKPTEEPTLSPVASLSPTISPTRMITGSPTKDFGVSLEAGGGESVDVENTDENQDIDNASLSTDLSNVEVSVEAEVTQQTNEFTSASSPFPPIDDLTATKSKSNLGVGLGVGIFVATVVCVALMMAWMYYKKKEQISNEETMCTAIVIDNEAQEVTPDKPDETSLHLMESSGKESPERCSDDESNRSVQVIDIETVDIEAAQTDPVQVNSDTTGAIPEQGNVAIPMLMTDLDASFTSSDMLGEFSEINDADIFDNYIDTQLEELREAVTSQVADTEGMMSLAMTQVLFAESETTAEDILDGASNPSEIEANFLFETYDWLKKNQQSANANEFFEEILNKTVVMVRIGILHPLDAGRIIFCCATILDLNLLKDFPKDVLLVSGMRKTNDASQGRAYLVDAMKEFGSIDGAAIALDKGFGFVRFIQSASVDLALERFRTAEIEVQGVSVMICTLHQR